jgi:hypothetical protein
MPEKTEGRFQFNIKPCQGLGLDRANLSDKPNLVRLKGISNGGSYLLASSELVLIQSIFNRQIKLASHRIAFLFPRYPFGHFLYNSYGFFVTAATYSPYNLNV